MEDHVMKRRTGIFLKIMVSIFILVPFLLLGQVIEGDSLALVALYDSTNGAGWTNSDGWLTEQ